jgi:hypothetical protein
MSSCFRYMQLPANEVSCELQLNYTLPNLNGHLYKAKLFRSTFYNKTWNSQFVFNLPSFTCSKSTEAHFCCWFWLRGLRRQPKLRMYTNTPVPRFQLPDGDHFQEFHLMLAQHYIWFVAQHDILMCHWWAEPAEQCLSLHHRLALGSTKHNTMT